MTSSSLNSLIQRLNTMEPIDRLALRTDILYGSSIAGFHVLADRFKVAEQGVEKVTEFKYVKGDVVFVRPPRGGLLRCTVEKSFVSRADHIMYCVRIDEIIKTSVGTTYDIGAFRNYQENLITPPDEMDLVSYEPAPLPEHYGRF